MVTIGWMIVLEIPKKPGIVPGGGLFIMGLTLFRGLPLRETRDLANTVAFCKAKHPNGELITKRFSERIILSSNVYGVPPFDDVLEILQHFQRLMP
jgi:hypothetical protein